MSEAVWILGINMTKFGKHPDIDTVDLAAQAAMAALADGGVTMADMQIMASGNLLPTGTPGMAQNIQKQIGQTGIPVYNVSNACATGATAIRTVMMAIKAGEADFGLATGVEKIAGMGLLAGNSVDKGDGTWTPKGRVGAVTALDGRLGTETMPGVFAQIGQEYAYRHNVKADFELFAKISEKNHAHSVLNPLAAYQKRFTLEEIMNDVMIAYPNTRPMCSGNCDGAAAAVLVSDAKLKTLSMEQQRRAVKISASILTSDPFEEACQVLPDPNALTRRAASDRVILTLSNFMTASPLLSWSTMTTSASASLAVRLTCSTPEPRGETVGSPSTSQVDFSLRAIRLLQRALQTSGRSATTSEVRRVNVRLRTPRWAWPTSSALVGPVACTFWSARGSS